MAKQYGLILPDKSSTSASLVFNASRNVFGNESDSDVEEGVPKAPLRTGDKLKRQAKIVQEKAVEEDPTVYQYDELYDDIEKIKSDKISSKKEEKKPKYIHKLIDAADKRKKENERRVERQVQKEREAEGDQFCDKESFVTSAYKKKLEEMKLEDEKEKRMQYLEEICDVTKQADLGGFYRHLYDQQLNTKDESEVVSKTENETKTEENKKTSDSSDGEQEKQKKKTSRSYRKRQHSNNDNEKGSKSESDDEGDRVNIEEIKANKKQRTHLQSNIDADSDFSIDESSSDDDEDKKAKKNKIKTEEPKVIKEESEIENPVKNDDFKKPAEVAPLKPSVEKIKIDEEEKIEVKEVKPKIDIWKKRTVGELFEQALLRYYERKSKRP